MRSFATLILLLFILSGNVSAKDSWDADGSGDNTPATTQNVLIHTAPAQVHDLEDLSGPVTDQDWYRIFPRANRSYEVQVFDVTDFADFNNPKNPPIANTQMEGQVFNLDHMKKQDPMFLCDSFWVKRSTSLERVLGSHLHMSLVTKTEEHPNLMGGA